MRGLELFIGYLLGNKTAREWCIKQLCQASCFVDKELKKILKGKDDEKENRIDTKQDFE